MEPRLVKLTSGCEGYTENCKHQLPPDSDTEQPRIAGVLQTTSESRNEALKFYTPIPMRRQIYEGRETAVTEAEGALRESEELTLVNKSSYDLWGEHHIPVQEITRTAKNKLFYVNFDADHIHVTRFSCAGLLDSEPWDASFLDTIYLPKLDFLELELRNVTSITFGLVCFAVMSCYPPSAFLSEVQFLPYSPLQALVQRSEEKKGILTLFNEVLNAVFQAHKLKCPEAQGFDEATARHMIRGFITTTASQWDSFFEEA